MTTLVGNLSLGVAMMVASLGVLIAIASARFGSRQMLDAARVFVVGFAGLIAISSAALVYGFLNNQFDIRYVAHYSERALPFGYKLAAFWAGQEGSLLLWALLLAGMGAIFAIRYRGDVGVQSSATFAALCVALGFFAALILFAANPFAPNELVGIDGQGLNPMLQDPGMIAHPPALFLGYAGFTIPFVVMIGALIAGRRDNNWVSTIRGWSLASWLFLSIGILLGAQWAYVELGWGGYWAWDPVENASLMPWLTGTALLHSTMVQKQRGMLKLWTSSLVAMTFILCIFGTYLTRSGVVQSVHSFGESAIGTMFLGLLIVSIVISIALIGWRRSSLRSEHEMTTLLGREGMFLAANVLLVGVMLVTLVGTIFPILSNLVAGQQITVSEKFYNKIVAPMGLLVVALMAVGPLLSYGAGAAGRLLRGLVAPAVLAAVAVVTSWFYGARNVWALACVAIATVALSNVVIDFVRSVWQRATQHNENPITAIRSLLTLNHRRYGAQIVHIGIVMIVGGIAGSSLFNTKETFQLHPGEKVAFAGGTLRFDGLEEVRRVNFTAIEATVTMINSDGSTKVFKPERRFYDKHEEANTEVAIGSTWKQDVYFTLAGWEQGGQVTAIQAIVNPLVSWIWTGGLVLLLGAVVGLLPRFSAEHATIDAPEPRRTTMHSKNARTGARSRQPAAV